MVEKNKSNGATDKIAKSDEEQVLYIKSKNDCVPVSGNRAKIKMVVDTGCKQNIISSQLYK